MDAIQRTLCFLAVSSQALEGLPPASFLNFHQAASAGKQVVACPAVTQAERMAGQQTKLQGLAGTPKLPQQGFQVEVPQRRVVDCCRSAAAAAAAAAALREPCAQNVWPLCPPGQLPLLLWSV